jgi:hypothetical protein
MKRIRNISTTLILTMLVLLSTTAVACAAGGSGNSSVDEYTEDVPNAGGNTGGGSGGGPGSGGGADLPSNVDEQFQQAGADGAAAASLAEGTSPSPAHQTPASSGDGGQGDNATDGGGANGQPQTGSGQPAGGAATLSSAPAGSADDSGGPGLVLPIILIAGLVGAIAYVLVRRSGRLGATSSAP